MFFVKPKVRYAMVAAFYAFHLMTFATITISFVPHQVAMASFLPLEKVRPVVWVRQLAARLATSPVSLAPGDEPHD